MKKGILIALLIIILGIGVGVLVGKISDGGIDFKLPTIDLTKDEEDIDEEEEEQEEDTEVEAEEGSLSDSLFSNSEQSVGSSGDGLYVIQSMDFDEYSNYYAISVNLGDVDSVDEIPLITASYDTYSGVIDLRLEGISEDGSGIGYHESKNIDVNGITRIQHDVTSAEHISLYSIGVSKSTTFYLDAGTPSNGVVTVTLNIKYPGSLDGDIDLGSSDFSSDNQNIAGGTKDDGIGLTTYSYSTSGSIFKIIWKVSSTGSVPLPTVSGRYDDSNILHVTFASLSSDPIVGWGVKSLPAGLQMTPSKNGDSSVYSFGGIGGLKNYRLYGTTSPNQIILEIDFK